MAAKQPKSSGMFTEVMEITPQQAAEFLAMNVTNRPIRRSWVATLEGIIERGEWQVTHQGIAITAENRLLDGQHRLQAIVNTGKTVSMNVSFDCSPGTFKVLDSGIRRTTADHLGVSPATTAVAKLIWRLARPHDTQVPSSTQVQDVLAWASEPIEEVLALCGGRTRYTPAGVQLALVVHLMAGRTEVMEKILAYRAGDLDNIPSSLRGLIKQILEKKSSAAISRWDLAVRAWRAFDPTNWTNSRIIVKTVDAGLGEMLRVADAYRKRAEKLRIAA